MSALPGLVTAVERCEEAVSLVLRASRLLDGASDALADGSIDERYLLHALPMITSQFHVAARRAEDVRSALDELFDLLQLRVGVVELPDDAPQQGASFGVHDSSPSVGDFASPPEPTEGESDDIERGLHRG